MLDSTRLKKQISTLIQKTDELENRNRRDNISVFGLKEGIEGRQSIDFFETWLPNILSLNIKDGSVKIERVHRMPGTPRKDNMPHVVISKLHNYADKMNVLAAFMVKQPVMYDSEGRCFNRVCTSLISKNIHFRMTFPATLTFVHGGEKYLFTKAEDAQAL